MSNPELVPTLLSVSTLVGHYVAARDVLPLFPVSPWEQVALNITQRFCSTLYQAIAATFCLQLPPQGPGRGMVSKAKELQDVGKELALVLETLPPSLWAAE